MVLASRLKTLALRWLPDPILFALKKRHYARAVRRFDDPETAFVRALVAEGDQALDLGANVGWYTYLLSQLVGPDGRVLSVEPVPETHRLLAELVEQLDLHNVTVFQRAVSDRSGTVVMEVPLFESGGENFYQARIVSAPTPGKQLRHSEVQRVTVDDLASDLRVAFIKGDVEGHELQLVRGALHTIRRSQPSWLLEVVGDPDRTGSTASQVFETLLSCGYAPYLICGGRLRLRRRGDRSDNYFFLAEEHLPRIRELRVPVEPSPPEPLKASSRGRSCDPLLIQRPDQAVRVVGRTGDGVLIPRGSPRPAIARPGGATKDEGRKR